MLCFKIIILLVRTLVAQEAAAPQNNLSPYFYIQTEGITPDQFPLLGTSVQAEIAGWVANVTVEQVYKNNGSVPIEAIYLFPASTRAAVYYLDMQIGSRKIVAEIREKQEARRNYEQAKSAGKRATLLEQQRPNVFQMQVANVLPGDEIIVTLKYNEFLIPENKKYRFVYPTVVGPRFVNPDEEPSEAGFAANPYLSNNSDLSPSKLYIEISLSMGTPIQDVRCHSHKTVLNWQSKDQFFVKLDEEEQFGGNRDFILEYRLSGEGVRNSTLLYEHKDEKFFLTTVQPPNRNTEAELLPREYIFVVDISGSMSGFPLEVSKELLRNLIGALKATDGFNIVLFAGGSQIFSSQPVLANATNIARAINFLDHQQGGGGTQLLPALQTALEFPRSEQNLSRSIVVVTDGYITVETEVFDLISENLGKNNLFAFGIGSGVNRHLIEGMAHIGRGEPFIITKAEFAPAVAKKFQNYIQYPLLANIHFEFEDFEVYDVVPQAVPDLFAERPVFIFGKYRGQAIGKITVSGSTAEGSFHETIDLNKQKPSRSNQAIRFLWAREKIRWLSDFNALAKTADRVKQITRLGLRYNLLTSHTSFVAIDRTPVLQAGEGSTAVKQPLPLPLGVSDHAVGFEMGLDETFEDIADPSSVPTLWVAITGMEPVKRNVLEEEIQNFLFHAQVVLPEGLEVAVVKVIYDLDKGWLLKDFPPELEALGRQVMLAIEKAVPHLNIQSTITINIMAI